MKLLKIDEAAKVLAVSRASLQRLIDAGRLPAIVITAGRRKRLQRVDESDLQIFIDNLKVRSKKNDPIRLAQNR
jgi:excisionase family DNA binding protein